MPLVGGFAQLGACPKLYFVLAQDAFDDMSADVGEAETAALVFVNELLVVDAHEVHERGLEVMHMYGVFDDVVAEVVGLAIAEAGFYACSGHPHAETAWVMVASVIVFGELAL